MKFEKPQKDTKQRQLETLALNSIQTISIDNKFWILSMIFLECQVNNVVSGSQVFASEKKHFGSGGCFLKRKMKMPPHIRFLIF